MLYVSSKRSVSVWIPFTGTHGGGAGFGRACTISGCAIDPELLPLRLKLSGDVLRSWRNLNDEKRQPDTSFVLYPLQSFLITLPLHISLRISEHLHNANFQLVLCLDGRRLVPGSR
ncbi:hypothetical protein PMIN02_011264 [Paraphaeosphaeria minitans]